MNFVIPTGGVVNLNPTLVDGIVGPWATWGSGTSLSYATVNGSSQIAQYSGGTAATAGTLTNLTTAATNYTLAAGATNYTLAAGATNIGPVMAGNTLQYSGATGTIEIGAITNNANTLTFNGLMNSGTGRP